MKKFWIFIGFLLISNIVFAAGSYDTDFQLKNYNKTLAASYLEQIVPVYVSSLVGTISLTMFDSYARHNGNVDALVGAYLLGVQTKYKLSPFRPAGSYEPVQENIASTALINNKDTVAFILVTDASVGVTFYFYDRGKMQWFKSFYQSFFE